MKFASVPCCCTGGCECTLATASQGGSVEQLEVVVDSGSLSGGSTASDSGQISITHDCFLEVSRSVSWQVQKFYTNLILASINSTLTWTHSGNGTDDIIFKLTKTGNSGGDVQIFLGATELVSQSATFAADVSGGGARRYWDMCINAEGGWAIFQDGTPTTLAEGFVYVPGDTISFAWDLTTVGGGPGPLNGVDLVSVGLAYPGCPSLCPYPE